MGCNMDKQIINFIKKYDISDLEIENILNISPMMDVLSYQEFCENCRLLHEHGYPVSDIDILLLANPDIFVRSYRDLKSDLDKLQACYGDLENILKENPTII